MIAYASTTTNGWASSFPPSPGFENLAPGKHSSGDSNCRGFPTLPAPSILGRPVRRAHNVQHGPQVMRKRSSTTWIPRSLEVPPLRVIENCPPFMIPQELGQKSAYYRVSHQPVLTGLLEAECLPFRDGGRRR